MSARLLLVLAAMLFLVRGPLRARSNYVNDFAAPYACGRLWFHGQNPYDPANFFPAWHAAGAPQGPVYANPSSTHPVYPPPSILVLLPFALLPWTVASFALTFVTAAVYVSAVVLLSRFVPGRWSDSLKPLFLAYALALAPVHSALHVSNLACLSAALLLLALYRVMTQLNQASICLQPDGTRADLKTAILLAISLCLKPTLAPLVLLDLTARKHRKTLAATLSVGLAISLASLYPLARQGSRWYTDLRANIHFVFTHGTANLSAENLTRFDRIDLQLPFYALTKSREAAAALAGGVTLVLLLLWLRARNHSNHSRSLHPASEMAHSPGESSQRDFDRHLLSLSVLLLIGLLPFYQRFYSAMLLLPLVIWCFRNLSRPVARGTLAFCSLFLVNTEVLQQKIGIVPAGATHLSLLQNAFLGPHLNWLLLLCAIALLCLQLPGSRTRDEADPTVEDLP